jgi:hypothetical protein
VSQSTHEHNGTKQTVTVKVNYGAVRPETNEERRARRQGELPVMMRKERIAPRS